jgi:hypothetical protein
MKIFRNPEEWLHSSEYNNNIFYILIKQNYVIKYFITYRCGSNLLIECPYVRVSSG